MGRTTKEGYLLLLAQLAVQGMTNNSVLHLVCGERQVFKSCERCIQTCSDPRPKCIAVCLTGCFCKNGFLLAPDGTCVALKNCPRAEITFGNVEQSIDECQPDEEFVWCGWCERTCSEPHPVCPNTTCTRGCLCRPPLLRHHSGHCVEEDRCLPQNCTQSNEEYSCRYGCEARCAPVPCVRPRRCRLGCHCVRALYRSALGECVTVDKCFDKNTIN